MIWFKDRIFYNKIKNPIETQMTAKQRRETYYRRVYGEKKFTINNIEKNGHWYIQAVNANNKKVGRPVKIGADAHKLLAKMYPSKFPPVEGFTAGQERLIRTDKRNITRTYKLADWQRLGFRTAKEGRETISILRMAGNFFYDPDVLSKVLNQIQGFNKKQTEFYLNRLSRKVVKPFRRVGDVVEEEVDQPHKNYLRVYKFTTKGNLFGRPNGLYDYFDRLKPVLIKYITKMLMETHAGVRFQLNVLMDFRNDLDPNKEWKDVNFNTESKSLLKQSNIHRPEDIEINVNRMVAKIADKIETIVKGGSGWVIEKIKTTRLNVSSYKPANGRAFFPLDKVFMNRRCLYIPQNKDDLCAWYCLVYGAESKNIKIKPERIENLLKFKEKYPIDPALFPLEATVNTRWIEALEKLFQTNIHIHVTTVQKPNDTDTIIVSKSSYPKITDLLLIQDVNTGQRHFALIKDYNAFRGDGKNKAHVCRNCSHKFNRQKDYDAHVPLCLRNETTRTTLPKPDKNICKFRSHGNKQLSPYTIIWDTETYFVPKGNKKGKNSLVVAEHRPTGVFALVHSTYENKVIKTFYHRGESSVKEFVNMVTDYVDDLSHDVFDHPKPLHMTPSDWKNYKDTDKCYVCDEPFASYEECEQYYKEHKKPHKKRKVKDHCHFTGKYRGSACNECNLQLKVKRVVPAIAHNFKGYDSHFLVQILGTDSPFDDIKIIPTNTEQFLQVTGKMGCVENNMMEVKFMDSMCHLSSGLDKLVKLLSDDDLVSTKEFIRSLSTDDDDFAVKWELAKTKGVYPYEYFDNFKKIDETSLPEVEHFVSSLEHHGKKFRQLTVKERLAIMIKYKRACKTWEVFGCKTLWDYHDFYLQLDVYLLNDVWQKHRKMAFEKFGIDPAYYPTLPSFCWDAMLSVTGVELELLTDQDMYMFLERGKIGGISMVGSKSYAEANHPLLSTYDKSQPHRFIQYADVNGLYSWAMKQLLPYKDFRWIDPKKFDLMCALAYPDDEDGYFLDIDFSIPQYLHNKFKDYPILPENILITDDMLSPHQQKVKQTLESFKFFNETSVTKLVPNLYDKKNHIIHIKHLALVLDLCGEDFDIDKHLTINKILAFKQRAWLKPYIELCMTERQKKGISDFEKDFWKLCSNAVYGKTMENTRDRMNLNIYTREQDIKKHLNDIRFHHFDVHQSGAVAIYNNVRSTKLNKPIYAGVAILNLSKVMMYDLWYNKLKRQYGDKISLMYTDTDSFIFEVQTHDFDADVDRSLWDFSEYHPDHPLFSLENKKVEGKVKLETHGVPISKFCGNRAKSYAFEMDDSITKLHTLGENCPMCKGGCQYSHQKCVGKGISRSILKTSNFDSYRRAKLHGFEQPNMCQTVDVYGFQSNNHTVTTVKMTKAFVSSFDDKRNWQDEYGIHQLPHGHYKISGYNKE